MKEENKAEFARWPTCVAGGILAALLFLAIWAPTHPARPLLPTSDLYTHLSVARHLARGEGFRTDVAYPLSFAFPFARELPQPLLHRQPGFPLLLTLPYLAADGYPARAVDKVRGMQILLLGLILAAGGIYFLRKRNSAGVLPWMILLYFNPLLAYAVDWGLVELVCALMLLVIWLRARARGPSGPDWIDGLLAGALSMLRLDLFWVPVLWWALLRPHPQERPVADRRLGLLLLAWLLVITPWAVRNIRVTGQPFFNLQTYAEHVKDTRSWTGYSVYKQLEPQPITGTLASDPGPVVRKIGRGVKFYFREMPRLVPLPVLLGLVLGAFWYPRGRLRRRTDPKIGGSGRASALIILTMGLLSFQYAVFDHSLRHLLVVLPVVVWEVAHRTGLAATALTTWPKFGWALDRVPNLNIAFAAVAAVAVILVAPCRVPGWDSAAREAVNSAPRTAEQIDMARLAGEGVLFSDNSAVPWHIDRPIVWSPGDELVRARICELLGMPEAVPGAQP